MHRGIETQRMQTLGVAMGRLLIVVACAGAGLAMAEDPRNIVSGHEIPSMNYADQPYVVVTPEGNWVCTLTTGPGREGDRGQHVVATISEDQGKTWSGLIPIEPADGPEASWAIPYITPEGRIYVFYDYNGDNVQGRRADMLGWYCYKYSDDGGRTWSQQRYRLPMRVTACDLGNDWEGMNQIFWGIDKPIEVDGVMYFGFTKLGRYMLEQGEGWFYRSENISEVEDAEAIEWELLPEGMHGLRAPEFGSVQEEHNIVPLENGDLYCMYRTTAGHPCHAYSRDGGRSWTRPEPATYTPGGRVIKHPRACPMVWRTNNGKYLFWFHNHGGTTFRDRNPVWISGGIEQDGHIHWSQPEILLYDDDPDTRMSYPDLIEQDGKYWVTETQKEVARVHQLDKELLEGLWAQGQVETVAQDGLALELSAEDIEPGLALSVPELPDLSEGGGFSIGMWLRLENTSEPQEILNCIDTYGSGFAVRLVPNGTLELTFTDGEHKARWYTDPYETLEPGKLHHVVFIVDGGPNIVSVVVDGNLLDGGTHRQYGWTRFSPEMGAITSMAPFSIATLMEGELRSLRVYDRYLRTSEAIANYHAGL